MKFFDASFDTVLMRYYLLMVVAVVPFLIGVPYLSFLAFPVFLTAFMGINFKPSINRARSIIFKREDVERKENVSAKAA